MSRWLIVLFLSVASATAWGQSVGRQPSMVTAKAQVDASTAERKVVALTATRNALAKQYAEQVAAVDRLKQQRKSWRQERELRERLAEAQDTATKLTAATSELARATTTLASTRRTLVTAIDVELASGAGGARATELARQKAMLQPQVPRKNVQKIVLPELEFDPLADPEELDQQVAALREGEAQLANQISGLDKQAKELDAVARLKKQHDRAGELARSDDDQPQRTATQSTGGSRSFGAADSAPEAGAPPPDGSGTGGGGAGGSTSLGTGGFEADASIVLAEVVDAGTIDTLTRAQRTGDPAQRALAAKKTRDAVAARLEQLRKKRAEIETLAKSRRLKR